MKKKVFIGITSSKHEVKNAFSANKLVTFINESFLDLFKEYEHVIPIILPSDLDHTHAKEIVSKLDALVLSSGQDVDPSVYNADNLVIYDSDLKDAGKAYLRPHFFSFNTKRDLLEINLYHAAKEKDIPILGICRGMQIINIAEGGSLFQEVPKTEISHFLEKDGWVNYHGINIEKDTKIHSIFNTTNYQIASIHHQAVNKLGKNLIASGKAEDGIIEIIEHEHSDFIIGIQGHMEKITQNYPLYKKLIKTFVEKASIGDLLYEF